MVKFSIAILAGLMLITTFGCMQSEERKIMETANKFHGLIRKGEYEKAFELQAKKVEAKYKKYDFGVFKSDYQEFKEYMADIRKEFNLKAKNTTIDRESHDYAIVYYDINKTTSIGIHLIKRSHKWEVLQAAVIDTFY